MDNNAIMNDFYGRTQWITLHCYAIAYTPDMAPAFVAYVNAIAYLMPCSICRAHFQHNLKKYPINNYLVNRESLFYWTYLLHDEVNNSKGRLSPPYHLCRQYYLRKTFG